MKHSLCVVLALIIMTGTAQGQVEKGDREIQANGTLITMENMTMINITGLYGYYYTEKLEFGGGPSITHVSISGFDGETNLSITMFGRYNFTARDKLVPYVSGQWYQFDLSPEEPMGFFDYSFLQLGGGFKYFLNEYVAYDISGNMGISVGGGDVSFIIVAGISFIL